MILGTKKVFMRHALVASIAIVLVASFWFSHVNESGDAAALWRAFADAAIVFLSLTLIIGPLTFLWKPALRFLTWRREFGIWFTVLAFFHILLMSALLFEWKTFQLIFAFDQGSFILLIGAVAFFWALILAFTSSDRAVKFLGINSWKWLHTFAYVIFYLAAFHAFYFLVIVPTDISFRAYIILTFVFAVPTLQISAFIRTVARQHKRLSLKKKNENIFAKVKETEKIAKGTYKVDFEIEGKDFRFEAGQHTGVWLPKLNYKDFKGKFRIFSITNSPNNKKEISIAFRDTGSGFKKTLIEFKGREVELMSPMGFFVLPKDKNQKVAFIAGGIGITPFMSMLRFAEEEKLQNKITLYYVNSSEETAAFLDEIKKIEEMNKNLTFKKYFGREEFLYEIKNLKNANEYVWHIAGPTSMVGEIKNTLSGKVHPENIITEEFVGY